MAPMGAAYVMVNDRSIQSIKKAARIQLTQEGVYDKRMMSLLNKVRRHHTPSDAECGAAAE